MNEDTVSTFEGILLGWNKGYEDCVYLNGLREGGEAAVEEVKRADLVMQHGKLLPSQHSSASGTFDFLPSAHRLILMS